MCIRDRLKLGWKLRLSRGARDVDAAAIERLAQRLEHAPVELGDFVEKEYALMRQ